MTKANFTGKLIKKDGKLVMTDETQRKLYQSFIDMIPEGATLEFYTEIVQQDATLAQIAKIHAMIREIALHTGMSFEDVKLVIKNESGLCHKITSAGGTEGLFCKSFGDTSREEMSLAITSAQKLGQKVNCPV